MSVAPRGLPDPKDGWRRIDQRRDMLGKVDLEIWYKCEPGSVIEPDQHHFWTLRDEGDVKDYAKFLRDTDGSRKGDQECMRQQAVILPSMLARSLREGWYSDMNYWRKIIADSDYRDLRTTDDRI